MNNIGSLLWPETGITDHHIPLKYSICQNQSEVSVQIVTPLANVIAEYCIFFVNTLYLGEQESRKMLVSIMFSTFLSMCS